MEITVSADTRIEDPPVPVGSEVRRRGVLLVNVGTPDAPDAAAVRRYLGEFLADPKVIQLPFLLRWMQSPLARFIAWRRAPHSAEKYRLVWTDRGSPLRAIMDDQAEALSRRLGAAWDVFIGMRYGNPSIATALKEIARREIDELVIVPLYPQFSETTTGTTLNEVYRVLKDEALHLNISARSTWYDDAAYVDAQAHLIADELRAQGLEANNAFLLFSAHGLPVSYVERGDPYERQIRLSARLIRERLGWPEHRQVIAFQSRLGPTEWLKPELTAMLRSLAEKGEKKVVVCPISFTTDCLETLEEVQIQAKSIFASVGGELHVCPALNTHPRFIDGLRQLVVRGPRPVVAWNRGHRPLLSAEPIGHPTDTQLDRVVMIGASLPNRLGQGRGPRLNYCDAEGLACAKMPHHEVETFLSALKSNSHVREAFVWNTCFRFECYAWLDSPRDPAAQECVVAALRAQLFSNGSSGVTVNTLFGRNVWHHLMRTIAGLNSGLPGDKDIVAQFRTAFQTAERAGTAGAHSRALVEETVGMAERVRAETAWGRVDPGYCSAAVTRVQDHLPIKLANLRHLVVGGSSTSRSVLEALYERFEVKEPTVTLAYRNHQGGQMKILRKAIKRGRRLRVHSYTEKSIHAAIADADVVYFGIDRDEPVLDAEKLKGLRDFSNRPLYILDFNTAGSTHGLSDLPNVRVWTASDLDAEVERHAKSLCKDEAFPQIVREAEEWIEEQLPTVAPPNLVLPCHHRDPHGHPACDRCGRSMVAAHEGAE